jgi:hypothetical protein
MQRERVEAQDFEVGDEIWIVDEAKHQPRPHLIKENNKKTKMISFIHGWGGDYPTSIGYSGFTAWKWERDAKEIPYDPKQMGDRDDDI